MRRLTLTVAILLLAIGPAKPAEFTLRPEHVTSLLEEEILENKLLGAAEPTAARELPPLALDLIKDFEQWLPEPYDDASRYCTVGYGHLIAKKSCTISSDEIASFHIPLTTASGQDLLEHDTRGAQRAVQRLVQRPLTEDQFGALVSFVFNVGVNNFAGSTLLKYLNEGDFYPGATKQFPRWVKSKNVALKGLVDRRACEAALFRSQVAYGHDHLFHRDDCSGFAAIAPPAEELIDLDVGEQRQ